MGVWKGLFDVSLVLELPSEGFWIVLLGDWKVWGSLGPSPARKYTPAEVHWVPWLDSGSVSLGLLLVPWPCKKRFPHRGPWWGFVSSGLFVVFLTWCIGSLPIECFRAIPLCCVECFSGFYSCYLTNHIKQCQ